MASEFKPFMASQPDGVPRLVILGRKSQPNEKNNNEAIDASIADVDKFIERVHKGQVHITRFGEQVSGMILDRQSIRDTEDLIAAGLVDAILVEDLGRLFRNPRHQYSFVQDCVDGEIRFIAVHDNLDTAEEGWQTALTIASVRHGLVVADTKRRENRSAEYAFERGGQVTKVRFGYRKLSREEAASGQFGPANLRIAKLSEWTDTIREMASWVCSDTPKASWEDLADRANRLSIPTGPYADSEKWTGPLFQTFISNQILGGYRTFRNTVSRQLLKTGEREVKKNKNGPIVKHYPELAHLTPNEYEALHEAIRARYVPREDQGKDHARYRVARSKSKFPAQHAVCSVCGNHFVAYDTDQVKCSKSGKRARPRCWNHVQVDVDIVRQKVLPWVLQQLTAIPGARRNLVDQCWAMVQSLQANGSEEIEATKRVIAQLEREAKNLASAISKGVSLDSVVSEAKSVEQRLLEARSKLTRLQHAARLDCPFTTRDEVDSDLEPALIELAKRSYEFGDLMKHILSEFVIIPVQFVETGYIRPRARITLSIDRPDQEGGPIGVAKVFDLFDPPQHVVHLRLCTEIKKLRPDASLAEIAELAGVNRMTVKRTLDLATKLEEMGLSDPYVEITQPPATAPRWTANGNQSTD